MNRTYKLYLQQKIIAYSKKIIILYIGLLIVIGFLYIIKNKYDEEQSRYAKERETLHLTSSKTTSMNVSKETIEKSFLALSPVRKENKLFDRQYIIETLTFYAQSSGLMNFVIDSVTHKPQIHETMYKSLSGIQNLTVFEVEVSFGSVLSKDLYQFLEALNRNINGIVVIQTLETKRKIETIDEGILRSLNTGQNIPVLGHKMIIHWFFVKNI